MLPMYYQSRSLIVQTSRPLNLFSVVSYSMNNFKQVKKDRIVWATGNQFRMSCLREAWADESECLFSFELDKVTPHFREMECF